MIRKTEIIWVIGLYFFSTLLRVTFCSPLDTSLVISTTEKIKKSVNISEPKNLTDVKLIEMKFQAVITNRFCKAAVISKMKNTASTSKLATFSVIIPQDAYISDFVMDIDGETYKAYVEDKDEAKKTFDKAVAGGLSAGHVSVTARDSNKFTVSVNVQPGSKATFYLNYEELLKRVNGKYEVLLNIHPGQLIKNLSVEIKINETRPLQFVKVANLRTGNEIIKENPKLDPQAKILKYGNASAFIRFNPGIEKQKHFAIALGGNGTHGLSGQFVVLYDVERDPNGGEVLVDDSGYFVHFLAPTGLIPIPKHVVFVLDTSGSMEGRRIWQLRDAINSILEELYEKDEFSIIEFGSLVKVWDIENGTISYEVEENPWPPQTNNFPEIAQENKTKQTLPPSFQANPQNRKKASSVVNKLEAYGGTDIKSALKVALEVAKKSKLEDEIRQPIIIFLTDGEATVGETDPNNIISSISDLNKNKYPIFSLSFGDGADRNLLQRLSLNNQGFSRHIYEASDASLQLQEFYKQISSPVLTNVTFKYTQGASNVTQITDQDFPILFEGSEIVISGVVPPDGLSGSASPIIRGWDADGGLIELTPPPVESVPGELERLWAHLTIRQFLNLANSIEDGLGKDSALRVARELALRYGLVTQVTSLVVVRPNSTTTVEVEDAGLDAGFPIIPSGDNFNPLNFPVYEDDPEPAAVSYAEGYIISEQNVAVRLQEKLPWLSSILIDNQTLKIDSKSYKLGKSGDILEKPSCLYTPISQNITKIEGICTLIIDCPKVYDMLTDVVSFKEAFCDLMGFAGLCCPSNKEVST